MRQYRLEQTYPTLKKEFIMQNINATASAAHKQAASEHQACADHHNKAATSHDNNKVEDAKASSKSAMSCCQTASKVSEKACGCSAK